MRTILFALLAVAASALAVAIDPHLIISPVTTALTLAPVSTRDFLVILGSTFVAGLIFHCLFNGRSVGQDCRLGQLCRTIICGSCAHLLTACIMFYTAWSPCDPNIYVLSLVIHFLLSFFGYLVFWQFSPSATHQIFPSTAEVKKLVIPTLAAGFLGVALVGTAYFYKRNLLFAEKVNLIQGWFSTTSSAYHFEDILNGIRLTQPIDFDIDGSTGDFYILERWGKVYRVDAESKELLLDFSSTVGPQPRNENGAYSLILHKNFGPERQTAYIYSTSRTATSSFNALWEVDFGLPSPETRWAQRRVVLKIPTQSDVHNSGSLDYGPEGFLFIGLGELGEHEKCQDPTKYLNGSILRIDPEKTGGDVSVSPKKVPVDEVERDYFVPRDNPFVGTDKALEEIWAYGMRNPFRLKWENSLGALIVGDIGMWIWEELNVVRAGENHGWPSWEAADHYKPLSDSHRDRFGFAFPYHAYKHTARDRSVLGGEIYQGRKFPSLHNRIIFGDNCSGNLWSLSLTDPNDRALIAVAPNFNQTGMTRLKTTSSGDILIIVMGAFDSPTGSIYQLSAKSGLGDLPSVDKGSATVGTGVEIYATHCSLCHGPEGRGDGMIAKESQIPMADFTSKKWRTEVDRDYLVRIIEEGGAALGKNAIMPPWKGTISEQEIENVIDYLYSLSEPKSVIAED